jgi:DNA-3-methyladenine glycosylase I
MAPSGLTTDETGRTHCAWRNAAPQYPHYHDHEWGVPVADDIQLYEKICLEGFQAGMAWITILRKREQFRQRNRAKILSTINNARRACELVSETGSLARWVWTFEPGPQERPAVVDMAYWTANPTSPASVRLSKALKKRGWTFVGPTTMYALMQAMGMVNDHLEGCVCRGRIEALRRQFERP